MNTNEQAATDNKLTPIMQAIENVKNEANESDDSQFLAGLLAASIILEELLHAERQFAEDVWDACRSYHDFPDSTAKNAPDFNTFIQSYNQQQ